MKSNTIKDHKITQDKTKREKELKEREDDNWAKTKKKGKWKKEYDIIIAQNASQDPFSSIVSYLATLYNKNYPKA